MPGPTGRGIDFAATALLTAFATCRLKLFSLHLVHGRRASICSPRQCTPLKERTHIMIVGRGLLASAFDAQAIEASGATLFASGVSNSSETDSAAYGRERDLLAEHLSSARGRFVYFSTCSIEDPDRGNDHYARHKVRMERMVMDHSGGYLILRLPQVVGRTGNPHTLTNFLADRLRRGESIPIWSGAIRCLIDVEHVAALTMSLLADTFPRQLMDTLAPPEVITMRELVDTMENVMDVPARREIVERDGGARPDSRLMVEMAPALGIDVSPGYTVASCRNIMATAMSVDHCALSVVIPVYRSESILDRLADKLGETLPPLFGNSFEVISCQ